MRSARSRIVSALALARVCIAVDPGASTGRAFWIRDPADRWVYIGPSCSVRPASAVVVWERPEQRQARGPRDRAAPVDDLVTLAFRAGVAVQALGIQDVTIVDVKPSVWKGQLPKGVTHARVRADLSAWERAHFDALLTDDDRDACAMGAWAVGR